MKTFLFTCWFTFVLLLAPIVNGYEEQRTDPNCMRICQMYFSYDYCKKECSY